MHNDYDSNYTHLIFFDSPYWCAHTKF